MLKIIKDGQLMLEIDKTHAWFSSGLIACCRENDINGFIEQAKEIDNADVPDHKPAGYVEYKYKGHRISSEEYGALLKSHIEQHRALTNEKDNDQQP